MKMVLGWCVFFAGVAGLGYWAMENQAKSIETSVATAATAIDLGNLPVTVEISGRDITLSGDLSDDAQRTELLDRMTRVEGVRHIHDNLQVAAAN